MVVPCPSYLKNGSKKNKEESASKSGSNCGLRWSQLRDLLFSVRKKEREEISDADENNAFLLSVAAVCISLANES